MTVFGESWSTSSHLVFGSKKCIHYNSRQNTPFHLVVACNTVVCYCIDFDIFINLCVISIIIITSSSSRSSSSIIIQIR